MKILALAVTFGVCMLATSSVPLAFVLSLALWFGYSQSTEAK